MNINDYKHPAARRLDEMILSGASPAEIASLITNLRLADIEPVCKGCVFIDRVFQPDFIHACTKADCLTPLTGLVSFMPKVVLQELSRHGKLVENDPFWNAISVCCGSRGKERVSRAVRLYNEEIDARMFSERPSGFDWVFDINYRSRDCVQWLMKSRWLYRMMQLDVILSVSDTYAWVIFAVLPSLRTELMHRLARHAFVGLYGPADERIDRYRAILWRSLIGKHPYFLYGLEECASLAFVRPQNDNFRSALCFCEVGLNSFIDYAAAKELTRFDLRDSVEEMKLGETITGRRALLGNLCRFVENRCVKLCCHYLPLMAQDVDEGLLSAIVHVVLRDWSEAEATQFLPVVESVYPGHLRNMHDSLGKNLLLYYSDPRYRKGEDKSKALIDLGCDPDERCLAGYTWNDIRRWEGAKQ